MTRDCAAVSSAPGASIGRGGSNQRVIALNGVIIRPRIEKPGCWLNSG